MLRASRRSACGTAFKVDSSHRRQNRASHSATRTRSFSTRDPTIGRVVSCTLQTRRLCRGDRVFTFIDRVHPRVRQPPFYLSIRFHPRGVCVCINTLNKLNTITEIDYYTFRSRSHLSRLSWRCYCLLLQFALLLIVHPLLIRHRSIPSVIWLLPVVWIRQWPVVVSVERTCDLCRRGTNSLGAGLGIVGNLVRRGASSVSQIFFILLRKILLRLFFSFMKFLFARLCSCAFMTRCSFERSRSILVTFVPLTLINEFTV